MPQMIWGGERGAGTVYCVKRVENESVIVCQCSTGRVNARVLRGPLGSLGAPGDVVARCCLVALAEDSRGASMQLRGREWNHDAAPRSVW